MKVENKNIEASKYELSVILEGEEWKKILDKTYNKLAKNVKVPGFRDGKAPKDMIMKHLSMQKIFNEATDEAIQESYPKALEESKLKPIVRPTVDLKSVTEDKIEFCYIVTCEPEVELGNYKGITIEKEEVKVTSEELNSALEKIQNQNAEMSVVSDRPVANNDIVNIDFTGYVDGKAFQGGSAQGYDLTIGSHTFIEGFEEQIVGMNTNEEKDIKVTFPENYTKDLAGKPATFKVKVNEIKTKILPEIDDNLALDANLEGVSNLEELKNYLTNDLKKRKENELDSKQFQAILDKIVESSKIEVADTLVAEQVAYKIDSMKQQLSQNGVEFNQYLEMIGSSEDKLKEELKPDAEKSVKLTFVIEALVKAENLDVSGEEVEAEVSKMADQYKIPLDKFKEQIKNQLNYLYYSLRDKKLYEFLKNHNNF